MTTTDYLEEVLASQDLADESQELKDLQEHRKAVEDLLRSAFEESSPTIRYGGSKAKGTLIKEAYDLDIVCYFPSDDDDAGASLKEIYGNVRAALEKDYFVEPKTSALRLRSKDGSGAGKDFHIDVVPGRYIDDSKTDCFLHQEGAEKDRLKTNLQVHIDHIKGSEVVDAIRLLKLWKVRRGIGVKQFIFELLVIKLLADNKKASLADQLSYVLESIRDAEEAIMVEDTANPTGNDLMPALRGATWQSLVDAAAATLRTVDDAGWEAVFGAVKKVDATAQLHRIEVAAAAIKSPSRPWYSGE